jgi:hypothetical protein
MDFPCFTQKVLNQLVRRLEHVGQFLRLRVPMVALTGLVVVSQNTLVSHDEGEVILVGVHRTWDGLREPPDHKFRE